MSVHCFHFRPQDVLSRRGELPIVFVERKPVRHCRSRGHCGERFFPDLLEHFLLGWICRAVAGLLMNAEAESQARRRDRPFFLREEALGAPGAPLLELGAGMAWQRDLKRDLDALAGIDKHVARTGRLFERDRAGDSPWLAWR